MLRQYFIMVDDIEVPVTEEVFKAYKRSKWRENKRSRYRFKVERSLDAFKDQGFDIPSDTLVEDIVADNMQREVLLAALSMLPEDDRLLIDALFFQEMTEREAAQAFGIPKSTVNQRKQSVLRKLKNILG